MTENFRRPDRGAGGSPRASSRSRLHPAFPEESLWLRLVPLWVLGLFALVACFVLFLLNPLPVQGDDISWYDNYDEAIREAKRTGKPIFLEFRCER